MPEKQPSDHDLLLRIDEKTKSIKEDLAELKTTIYGEAGLKKRVQRIENIWISLYGFLITLSLIIGIISSIILMNRD